MNEYMKQTHNFEDSFDLIKRSRKIRDKLKEYAINFKCKKIAVVSHFYTIGYTVSDNFDEKGKTVPKFHIENAVPYEYTLSLKWGKSTILQLTDDLFQRILKYII